MILNLGAGKKLRDDAINVDIMAYPGIAEVTDLASFPWKWDSESCEGIYASHIIEHFPDQKKFLDECYRILKPGAFLRMAVPHASSITSVGCLGHYRTYSYNTFHDYLSKPFYMFKDAKYRTVEQRLRWWYEEIDAEGNMPVWMRWVIKIIGPVINTLVNISPRVFENLFSPMIQCREVIWKGVKL